MQARKDVAVQPIETTRRVHYGSTVFRRLDPIDEITEKIDVRDVQRAVARYLRNTSRSDVLLRPRRS